MCIRDRDGSCRQADASIERYALNPVDTSTLAAFDAVVVDRNDVLASRVWVSEDGAYQFDGAIDLARGDDCGAWDQSSPSMCTPVTTSSQTSLHADASCDSEGLVARYSASPGCDSPEPIVAIHSGEVRELGDIVAPEDVHRGTPTSCDLDGGDIIQAWSLGAPPTPGLYPPVQLGSIGTGRVTSSILTTEDGRNLSNDSIGGLVDSDYGECFPTETPDGIRCIPRVGLHLRDTGPLGSTWADAGCSQTPLFRNPDDDRYLRVGEVNECGVIVVESVVEVGAAHSGATYLVDEPGACREFNPGGDEFFEVAQELEPSAFVAVETVIE